MTDTKWTKGEWFMDNDFAVVTTGGFDVLWARATVRHQERVANAALACAAPDLYEALIGVIAVSDRKTVEYDRARAALAKARGEAW